MVPLPMTLDIAPSETLNLSLSVETLWQESLALLRQQMSRPSYETWIHTVQLESFSEQGHAVLSVASEFNRNYVRQHYRTLLTQVLSTVSGRAVEVDFSLRPASLPTEDESDESASSLPAYTPPVPATAPLAHNPGQTAVLSHRLVTSQLNPRYTFDAFVVGQHNRLAHAAAMAIARMPAQQYNPFFVYGPSGLGKTHLIQAIGHTLHHQHPGLKVQYVTAEEFTNGLINAIAHKQMKAFRDRYRLMDVLIVDDVQFLEGKERTQEEMFHTFNALHQAGKQIILTSDRPARALADLEDRLRSRFEWGLMADISPPDVETRVAILQHKIERDGLLNTLPLGHGVLQTLAELVPHNVRELEGALNKLAAVSMLEQRTVQADDIPALLGLATAATTTQSLTHQDILQAVAAYYCLKPHDLTGPCRGKDIVHARQVACHLLRTLTHASFPQIGEWLGNRRHSTIVYACDKAAKALTTNPLMRRQVDEIERHLQALTKAAKK